MNKQQVIPQVGQVWINILTHDELTLKLSDCDDDLCNLFTFKPANDLEWLAVNVDEWGGKSVEHNLHKRAASIYYVDYRYCEQSYTRQQWQGKRNELYGLKGSNMDKQQSIGDFTHTLDDVHYKVTDGSLKIWIDQFKSWLKIDSDVSGFVDRLVPRVDDKSKADIAAEDGVDDKPVFTQAMCDAEINPSIGMMCDITHDGIEGRFISGEVVDYSECGNELLLKCESIPDTYPSDSRFKTSGIIILGQINDHDFKFSPIYTRTDQEKLIDKINAYLNCDSPTPICAETLIYIVDKHRKGGQGDL